MKMSTLKRSNHMQGAKGFTLIETLVGLSIFAVISIVFYNGLMTSTRISGMIEEKEIARTIIVQQMEAIRLADYSANYSEIATPDGYDLVIVTEGSNDDINWVPSTGTETLQRIFVSVYRGDRFIMRICTFRTPRID